MYACFRELTHLGGYNHKYQFAKEHTGPNKVRFDVDSKFPN